MDKDHFVKVFYLTLWLRLGQEESNVHVYIYFE